MLLLSAFAAFAACGSNDPESDESSDVTESLGADSSSSTSEGSAFACPTQFSPARPAEGFVVVEPEDEQRMTAVWQSGVWRLHFSLFPPPLGPSALGHYTVTSAEESAANCGMCLWLTSEADPSLLMMPVPGYGGITISERPQGFGTSAKGEMFSGGLNGIRLQQVEAAVDEPLGDSGCQLSLREMTWHVVLQG
ncbi:MAG: hypothetical protein B7733_16475 [Myxococcales bacterium FL481]|nr:MAG: hypothetical protein B7733_16475 [Myxococcales bacterium FL481]